MQNNNDIKAYPPEYTYGDFNMGLPGQENPPVPPQSAMTSATKVEESKAIAEIKAAVLMAKQCPRSQHQAMIDIVDSCKRKSLAEVALYAYPRGKTIVEGPSIRLAETLARHWGNLRVGIKIINQTTTQTEAKAFAYDLQTNYAVEQEFVVSHKRTTKKGVTILTDERDIRELVQNIGSRHLRNCIIRVIPSDIVEEAEAQVRKTLLSSDIPLSEQIKKMVLAFDEIGVSVEHLEKRLGHNMDATIPTEILSLKSIYRSIRDGMATREDFFEIGTPKAESSKDELKALIEKNKAETKTKPKVDIKNSLEEVANSEDAG